MLPLPIRVVRERISASGTVKKAARVAVERKNARGAVEAAAGIVKQGSKTSRRILVAGSEVVKRLEPSAGIPDTTGATHEHTNPFAIIGTRDIALRVGTYRFRHRRKPKTAQHERQRDEKACRAVAAREGGKTRRNGDRLTEFLNCEVVMFFAFIFC